MIRKAKKDVLVQAFCDGTIYEVMEIPSFTSNPRSVYYIERLSHGIILTIRSGPFCTYLFTESPSGKLKKDTRIDFTIPRGKILSADCCINNNKTYIAIKTVFLNLPLVCVTFVTKKK